MVVSVGNHLPSVKSWMVCGNVFYALAARLPAQAIGGIVMNISVRLFCCRPIAGFRIAVMNKNVNGLTRLMTAFRCIAAIRL